MAKTLANVPQVKLSLRLPEDIYDIYAERAAKSGRTVEAEIADRLSTCRNHTSVSPVYFDDSARNELSQLAGTLMRTPEDVLRFVRHLVSLKVAGIEVPLSAQLITRLTARSFGRTWEETIRYVVVDELEKHVGMR